MSRHSDVVLPMFQESLELTILDGEQAGVRTPLNDGEKIRVGSSFDNDIIIRGKKDLNGYFVLDVGAQITITTSSDAVYIDNELINPGQVRALECCQIISVGGIHLSIGHIKSKEIDYLLHCYKQGLDTLPAKMNGSNKESVLPLRAKFYKHILSASLFIMFSLLAVTISILFVRSISFQEEKMSTIEKEKIFESFLLNYDHIELTSANDGLKVAGFVKSYQRYNDVKNKSEALSLSVNLDIGIGEKIVADVLNVYRANDIESKAELIENGIVHVETWSLDEERIEEVRRTALRDIPHLQDIKQKNNVPASHVDKKNNFLYGKKRIISIVQGNPSYFITSDQARYFIGSTLPSGHIVEAISEDTVTIIKGKKAVHLKI